MKGGNEGKLAKYKSAPGVAIVSLGRKDALPIHDHDRRISWSHKVQAIVRGEDQDIPRARVMRIANVHENVYSSCSLFRLFVFSMPVVCSACVMRVSHGPCLLMLQLQLHMP